MRTNLRKTILFAVLMTALLPVAVAQTFTVDNNDGVAIKYTVTNGQYVKVESNGYNGRVVVPEVVTYQGTTYTVNEVAMSAFANASGLDYVSLPQTLTALDPLAFSNSGLDTLVLNCETAPGSSNGNEMNASVLTYVFGTNLLQTVVVMVPAGRLAYYRTTPWEIVPHLTSPIAVPVTMYVPKNAMLVAGFQTLKTFSQAAGYFTIWYEVGNRVWLAPYHISDDTVFLGWDKGDVYLTEITGPDTLRPIYEKVGYGNLDVNNVSTPVRFNGEMGYLDGAANYYVPSGSGSSPLFSNGLWLLGSNDNGYGISTSNQNSGDFVPGPLTVDGQCRSDLATRRKFNRVWSVSRQEIDDFIAHVGTAGYTIPENILSWPGNGDEGYAEQLAPYYDANGDGVYNPHHGDYPLIKGDRMVFGIFNDRCVHRNTGSAPLFWEVHMSAFAFDEPADTSLNNTVFVSYKVINRSGQTYTTAFMGASTDFDLGYANDDFIGCDVRTGMAYGYNGPDNDQMYQGTPPAQGAIMIAGPYADSDGQDYSRVDINKMQQYYPTALENYQLGNGTYDMVRLNADADLYYPDGWSFVAGFNCDNNCYNSSINGMGYGNGIVDDERMGMCSFLSYNNATSGINSEMSGAIDYINYLQGLWKDGTNMTYGGSGMNCPTADGCAPTTFLFPGDSDPLHWGTGGYVPVIDAGWTESTSNNWTEISAYNNPGDRRGVQGCGPFSVLLNEENTVDMAYTTAFGNTTAWSSVEKLREQALTIRRQFAHDTTDSGRPFVYMPYSAPIEGIDHPVQSSVAVYPNPASDKVTVTLSDGVTADIEIYDMHGSKVRLLRQVSGTVFVDLSGLTRGVYVLRCGNTTTKLVKK